MAVSGACLVVFGQSFLMSTLPPYLEDGRLPSSFSPYFAMGFEFWNV